MNLQKIEALGQGKVEYYSVELGAKVNGISHKSYLEEDAAEYISNLHTLLILIENLILNIQSYLKGRKSIGEIQGRGAVKDTAQKVFRGNLYFERGASKSEGREGECNTS